MASLGSVAVVEQNMKTLDYLNITEEKLRTYMVSALPNENEIFEQDNARCHRAQIALGWFQKRNKR